MPAIIVLLVILFKLRPNDTISVPTATECSNLTQQQLSSERSLGLIVQNRSLLSVKLAGLGEKNYSPPGGHVETGETPVQALSRELQEEVNLTVGPNNLTLFKVICEPRYESIERTYFYSVANLTGEIAVEGTMDRLKWVNYSYSTNKKADSELKSALQFLKDADLVD